MMAASQASLRTVWGGDDRAGQGVSCAADGVYEAVVLDEDDDLGFGGGGGGASGSGRAPADLDEGFGAAPVGRARVPAPVLVAGVWCGQGVERGGQDGARFGVEPARDRRHPVLQWGQA